MSDLALYCSKCGSSCDWPSEEVKGFDPQSGDHKHRYRSICQNKRHMFDGHHKSSWMMSTHSADECNALEEGDMAV